MARLSLQDLGRSEAALTPPEALAVIGLAAACSDGKVEDIELTELIRDLDELVILSTISEEEREDFVLRLVGLADREGLAPLLGTALEALTTDWARETAITLTINILTADGELPEAEFDYLRQLKQRLGLTDEQYDRARRAAAP
jgi:tellurite resistance protein